MYTQAGVLTGMYAYGCGHVVGIFDFSCPHVLALKPIYTCLCWLKGLNKVYCERPSQCIYVCKHTFSGCCGDHSTYGDDSAHASMSRLQGIVVDGGSLLCCRGAGGGEPYFVLVWWLLAVAALSGIDVTVQAILRTGWDPCVAAATSPCN
jgi:hypothetical protein